MKKISLIFVSVLVILVIGYVTFSIIRGSNVEYKAKRLLARAVKTGAVDKIREVIEKYPNTEAGKTANVALGEFYLNNNKYDEALKTANDLIDKYRSDRVMLSQARFLRANVYENQGQWDKAMAEYKILRENYTDTPIGIRIPIYIGDNFKRMGRFEESVKAYSDASTYYENLEDKNRGNPLGYTAAVCLVDSYLRLNNYEIAGKYMEDAIKNYPSDQTYIQFLPKIEEIYVKKLQKPEKAMEIYESMKNQTKDAKLKDFLDKKIKGR